MSSKCLTIEESILRHSGRGMDILYEYSEKNYCTTAGEALLSLRKDSVIGICTGFYCYGSGETDGPIGTHFLAKALKQIGFVPIVITDSHSSIYFDEETDYKTLNYDTQIHEIPDDFSALIAIERCGRADDGNYYNMKGKNINETTARIDNLFIGARCLTIGIGDGGNEIGMGNMKDIISQKINIIPSVITTTHLIISTVSNWGAYGLIAAISKITNTNLLPTFGEVKDFLEKIVNHNAVDGTTGLHTHTVDGFDIKEDETIITELSKIISQYQKI